MDEETRESRRLFMAVAVMEHHQMLNPGLDVYDICERLGALWKDVRKEAEANHYRLEAEVILALHARVAQAFDGTPGEFVDRDGWRAFLSVSGQTGNAEEDEGHGYNWIFAKLYWEHLTRYRFATVWIFVNALRLQRRHELNRLSVENLGKFLDDLSGAGPPISDGQTFYAQDFS